MRWKNASHYVCDLTVILWLNSPLLGLGHFFSFFILYTVSRTPWTGDQPVARPLPVYKTTQNPNKYTQTSIPRVGFEPTTLLALLIVQLNNLYIEYSIVTNLTESLIIDRKF
jgi:hypothetical protein